MLKGDLSINFEHSKAPLKVTPSNTWVRIDGFKNPFQLIELTFQTIKIKITNHPEATMLQSGKQIRLYFLDTLGELTFETDLRILSVSKDTCLCQIPLYVTTEQVLFDKLILEVQKNEIDEKKLITHLNSSNQAQSTELNYCVIKTEEELNEILNELVAQLPLEENVREEEKVKAGSFSAKPSSSIQEEIIEEIPTANLTSKKTTTNEEILHETIDPYDKLRDSIQNKFLLEGLEKIERTAPQTSSSSAKSSPEKITRTRRENPEADAAFNSQNLNIIEDEEKTNEYQFNLAKHAPKIDKDKAFEDSYDYDSELPPELIFSLSKKAPQKKNDEDFVINTATPEDLSFSIREEGENDGECVDGDHDCIKNKLSKFFKKKTIKFNLNKNEGEELVEKTDEEKDKEFQESRGKVAPQAHKARFNLDI